MKAIVIVFLTIGGFFALKFSPVLSKDSAFTSEPKVTFWKPFSFAESNPIWFVKKINFESPGIGDYLLKANLIKDARKFSIKLNNNEMIVDGVKQPEEIHQQFLKKYQKNPDDKVNIAVTINPGKGC